MRTHEVSFLDVFNGVPTKDLSINDFKNSESVESLLNQTSFFNSNSEIRRLVNQNSISINKIKIDSSFKLSQIELINNKYILVQKGKKNYYLISITG